MNRTQSLSAIVKRLGADSSATLSADEERLLLSEVRATPASPLATLLLLRHRNAAAAGSSPELAEELRHSLALRASDRRTLLYAFGADKWLDLYPAEPRGRSLATEEAIDTFLRTYGNSSPGEEELLERLIFNPTPDYAEMLAREEQDNLPPAPEGDDDSSEARINAFILSQHPSAKASAPQTDIPEAEASEADAAPAGHVAAPAAPADDSLLSESLAKIFIKQGRYERAFEIISGLSLKYPKKSVYFADQLRFLRKLMANRRLAEAAEAAPKPAQTEI